jgi:SAM-dependent methyltransferase
LADAYDAARPRYPAALFDWIVGHLDARQPWSVLDAGAGTGIALEALLPLVPAGSRVMACDRSEDMAAVGRARFPQVQWTLGAAEEVLESSGGLSLVIAAQSFHWMDRPRFLAAARDALAPEGVLAVVQNDRDHASGGFAGAYEDLLERHCPGYARGYRAFDIAAEIAAYFSGVATRGVPWTQVMSVEQFLTLSQSSTQAQAAIRAVGAAFTDQACALASQYAVNGRISLPYVAHGFLGLFGDRLRQPNEPGSREGIGQ